MYRQCNKTGQAFGAGIDIIRIDRVRAAIKESGIYYLKEIFSYEELDLISVNEKNPIEITEDLIIYVATRFAAKEAVFKALGTTWESEDSFRDIRIFPSNHGGVYTVLTGRFAKIANDKPLALSLSWDSDYAIAVCA